MGCDVRMDIYVISFSVRVMILINCGVLSPKYTIETLKRIVPPQRHMFFQITGSYLIVVHNAYVSGYKIS